jgi:hypothetical protein
MTRRVRNMTSAKACEASMPQDMRKEPMSSSVNRTLHANFEPLSREMNRYGLFQNCCNSTENAAAAKRHNTTIEPAAALESSTRFTAAPSPRSARDIAQAVMRHETPRYGIPFRK